MDSMNMGELNSSIQSTINLSSSETEEKELSHFSKKSKGSSKSKPLIPKTPKKTTKKYRPRKVVERLSKESVKLYDTYQNESCSAGNGGISEESEQKVFSKKTDPILPLVEVLEKCNFKYELKPDLNKQHYDFFLQDQYMNSFFNYYPDYICIDLLCEIIELELNLYLFISVDSNGHCEIIAIGLFKTCEAGLTWFCEVFKKHNLNWRRIRLIMSDKTARNSEILKSVFPEKIILLSFFHSMKALKKDLSNLDCKITEEEINKVVHIFEQMIFASDECSYSELLKQIKSMSPVISTYFRKAWHQKKDTWTLSQQLNSKSFLKSFNSYLNLLRKTIRPSISTLDSTESVIKSLHSSVQSMREQWFKNFTAVFPLPSDLSKQMTPNKYYTFLTSHGVELVSEQIRCSEDVKNMKRLASGKYICSSEDIVTINICSCNFFQLFSLPCSHIFSLRKFLSLPLYTENVCSGRWILTNYQRTYIELQNVFSTSLQTLNMKQLFPFGSFPKYFKICSELWPLLVLQESQNVSQDRLLVLKNLINAWENGIKVSLKTSESQKVPLVSSQTNVVGEGSVDYWKDLYGISMKEILDSDNDVSVLPFTASI